MQTLDFILGISKWVKDYLFSKGIHSVNTAGTVKILKMQYPEVKLKSGEEDPEKLSLQWEVNEGFTDKLTIALSLERGIEVLAGRQGVWALQDETAEEEMYFTVGMFMKLQIFLNIWPTIQCMSLAR